MPLKNARYRVKTFKSGKKVRLAFKGKKKVVETKSLETGAKAPKFKPGSTRF